MTASTSIFDYVGRGTHANRPASPNINSGGTALYYETDTGNHTYIWTGAAWTQIDGTGTVISVATGTGLSGGTITTTGTLSLANTAVTPAAYTNANITVDQQGRITAAANGSGGSAGAMVQVGSTLTASNSATLDFTGLATFTTYKLIGRFLLPATDNVGLNIVVGSGGGPTWANSGYFYSYQVTGQSGTASSQSQIGSAALAVFNVHNAAPGVATLDVTFTTDGSNYVAFGGYAGYLLSATSNDNATFSGWKALGAALTGIRLIFSSGNITSGKVSLYSIAS